MLPWGGVSNIDTRKLFYIMTLGVVEHFRHAGIATMLVEKLLAAASMMQSYEAIFLHVLSDNVAAQRFYSKLGFVQHKLLQDYYLIGKV